MSTKDRLQKVRKILNLKKFGSLNFLRITHTQCISNKVLDNPYYIIDLLQTMQQETIEFIDKKISEIKNVK